MGLSRSYIDESEDLITVHPYSNHTHPRGDFAPPFFPADRFQEVSGITNSGHGNGPIVDLGAFETNGAGANEDMPVELAAGETHPLTLEADRLSSGLYIIRIEGEAFSKTRKVTLVK